MRSSCLRADCRPKRLHHLHEKSPWFESSRFLPEHGTLSVGDCVLLSAGAPESSPIEVTGLVSPIDPHQWIRFKAGPGLFLELRNISGRNILGFALETTFTNPETGKAMAAPREHGAFRPASRGILLPSGANKPNPIVTLAHCACSCVFFPRSNRYPKAPKLELVNLGEAPQAIKVLINRQAWSTWRKNLKRL